MCTVNWVIFPIRYILVYFWNILRYCIILFQIYWFPNSCPPLQWTLSHFSQGWNHLDKLFKKIMIIIKKKERNSHENSKGLSYFSICLSENFKSTSVIFIKYNDFCPVSWRVPIILELGAVYMCWVKGSVLHWLEYTSHPTWIHPNTKTH